MDRVADTHASHGACLPRLLEVAMGCLKSWMVDRVTDPRMDVVWRQDKLHLNDSETLGCDRLQGSNTSLLPLAHEEVATDETEG